MAGTSNAPEAVRGVADCQPAGDRSQINSSSGAAQARPVFILKLEAVLGIDGAHALRELLKLARRDHGLHCFACHKEHLSASNSPAAAASRPVTQLPPRQPHKAARRRLELLRAALSCPEMYPGLVALTRLSIEALERVAAGKTTLARTQWRRLGMLLGAGVGR